MDNEAFLNVMSFFIVKKLGKPKQGLIKTCFLNYGMNCLVAKA